MNIENMDSADKLNFLISVLKGRPEIIDRVVDLVKEEIDEQSRTESYNLVVVTTKDYFERMKQCFEAKDNDSPGENLLYAIDHACKFNRLIPQWARMEFIDAFSKYRSYEVGTFPEAFKLEKRRNIATRRKNWEIRYLIWQRVEQLHRNKNRPIDRGLFDDVGKEFFISGSKVEVIYYSVKNMNKRAGGRKS